MERYDAQQNGQNIHPQGSLSKNSAYTMPGQILNHPENHIVPSMTFGHIKESNVSPTKLPTTSCIMIKQEQEHLVYDTKTANQLNDNENLQV